MFVIFLWLLFSYVKNKVRNNDNIFILFFFQNMKKLLEKVSTLLFKLSANEYVFYFVFYILILGPSWPWSYGSWIYNYLCDQCLSPLMLWVRISIRARCTTFCDTVCQWLATGQWFSLGPLVYSTNKTDRHDIAEILLKVALSTI
jgi:hypothetical protein